MVEPAPVWRGLLLALPPLIALTLWWESRTYDPGLLTLNIGAENALLPQLLAGLPRQAATRRFTRQNLWEHVNGHAEYFIAAGFQGLSVGEYGRDERNQPRVAVDLFDMGAPLHAFGALMDEAGQGEARPGPGEFAFASSQGLSFMRGRYYVKITAFAPMDTLPALAAELDSKLPRSGQAMTFQFPELGPTLNTRFVKSGYRGWAFMSNVLERTMQLDGKPVTVFLTVGGETAAHARDLGDFLQKEGIPFTVEEQDGVRMTRVTDPYEGEWFFLTGKERLLGVFSAWSPAMAAILKGFMLGHATGSTTR